MYCGNEINFSKIMILYQTQKCQIEISCINNEATFMTSLFLIFKFFIRNQSDIAALLCSGLHPKISDYIIIIREKWFYMFTFDFR